MVAMKKATDAAGDMISELTLEYNKVRQEHITNQLAELATAAEAMEAW
jgi:F-type H+-transporting ATPase subunit gamma